MAEYFAYDTRPGDFWIGPPSQSDAPKFVRLVDTDVKVPVRSVKATELKREIKTHVQVPKVKSTECVISGWIGDPSARMTTAVATLDGCAILPLITRGERTFRDVKDEDNKLPVSSYYDSRSSEVVQLTAGEWKATIHSFSEDKRDSLSDEPPYSISIRNYHDSTFELNEQSEALQVLRVLRLLVSFSSQRWVEFSTIYGGIRKSRPNVANRAFIGRFGSRGWSEKREVDISELGEWPVLLQGLWKSRESSQMRSALTHLISCGDRSKDGVFSYQDLVDAGGALEAAIRVWNDLPIDHRFFGGKTRDSLVTQLAQVVSEFQMGDLELDRDEVFRVVMGAFDYRHLLGHGSGGEIYQSGSDETGKLFVHQQYLYYLARLLVLDKLGGSTGHPASPYYAPKLTPA